MHCAAAARPLRSAAAAPLPRRCLKAWPYTGGQWRAHRQEGMHAKTLIGDKATGKPGRQECRSNT